MVSYPPYGITSINFNYICVPLCSVKVALLIRVTQHVTLTINTIDTVHTKIKKVLITDTIINFSPILECLLFLNQYLMEINVPLNSYFVYIFKSLTL